MNQIQSRRLHFKGPWSAQKTNKLLKIVNGGLNSGEFKIENGILVG